MSRGLGDVYKRQQLASGGEERGANGNAAFGEAEAGLFYLKEGKAVLANTEWWVVDLEARP